MSEEEANIVLSTPSVQETIFKITDIEELENFVLCRRYVIDKCIYNEDWYIVTTYDGKIYGDFLKFNPKAEFEYKVAFGELVGMNYDTYKEKMVKRKS